MLFDMNEEMKQTLRDQKIIEFDEDNTRITLTYAIAAIRAIEIHRPTDSMAAPEKRLGWQELARRILKASEEDESVELSDDEVALIKERSPSLPNMVWWSLRDFFER